MAQLIDGKLISQQIKDELKEEVAQFKAEGIDICLAVIQVGSDPASSVYVRNKKKACAYIGVESRSYELPEETSEEELIKLVEELNADESVNGILVQLPVPDHIDEDKIIRTISPCKCWKTLDRRKRIFILYSGRNHSAFEKIEYFDRRKRMCDHWTKQYRR